MSSGSPSCASIASAAASGSDVSAPVIAEMADRAVLPNLRVQERLELGVVGDPLAGEGAGRAVARTGDLGEAAGGRDHDGRVRGPALQGRPARGPRPARPTRGGGACTREELVCALSRERDRYMPAGEPAEGEKAESRQVRERLVHVPDELFDSRGVLLELQLQLVVIGPRIAATSRASASSLVGDPAKPTANVFTGSLICSAIERDDEARVQATAEHRAERNVGHEAKSHRFPKPLEERRHVLANVGVRRPVRQRSGTASTARSRRARLRRRSGVRASIFQTSRSSVRGAGTMPSVR